jgi:hypothetical protein
MKLFLVIVIFLFLSLSDAVALAKIGSLMCIRYGVFTPCVFSRMVEAFSTCVRSSYLIHYTSNEKVGVLPLSSRLYLLVQGLRSQGFFPSMCRRGIVIGIGTILPVQQIASKSTIASRMVQGNRHFESSIPCYLRARPRPYAGPTTRIPAAFSSLADRPAHARPTRGHIRNLNLYRDYPFHTPIDDFE